MPTSSRLDLDLSTSPTPYRILERTIRRLFRKDVNREHSLVDPSNPTRPAYNNGRIVEVFAFGANRAFTESHSTRSLARDERHGAALRFGTDPPGNQQALCHPGPHRGILHSR